MSEQPSYEELTRRVTVLETALADLKKREEKLSDRLDFTTRLLDALPFPVFYKDREGRYLGCNPAFTKLTGLASHDLKGKTAQDIWPEKEADVYQHKDRELMNNPPYQAYELQTEDRHGTARSVLFNRNVLRDRDGNIAGLVGSFSDLSHLRQAEKTVKENELKFRNLFDLSPQPVILIDLNDHTIIDVNDSYCELTQYDKAFAVGKKPSETGFYNEMEMLRFYRQLVSYGRLHGFETGLRTQSACELTVLLFARVIEINERKVALNILFDKTAQKKREDKLRQSRRLASLGKLASGIAHDFNNILFPIAGISEMMLDKFPPGSLEHENMKQVMAAAERGSELAKQIQTFSRHSQKKLIPVQVADVLKETLNLSRSTIPANIEVTGEFEADSCLVMADPTQLHQIGMNLIVNACHAIEPNPGCIHVKLKKIWIQAEDAAPLSIEPGHYATLSVSDTGSGISPDIMGRIFDPYFTTKDGKKGTGLGLSVVYGIISEYGGDIKVTSEPGNGTVFNVYIPLIEAGLISRTDDPGTLGSLEKTIQSESHSFMYSLS